jgi:hypothetical protein
MGWWGSLSSFPSGKTIKTLFLCAWLWPLNTLSSQLELFSGSVRPPLLNYRVTCPLSFSETTLYDNTFLVDHPNRSRETTAIRL